MNILKQAQWSLAALTLGGALAACGGSDDQPLPNENEQAPTVAKRLIRVEETFSVAKGSWKDIYNFTYDSEGRLTRYVLMSGEDRNSYSTSFTWRVNQFVMRDTDSEISFSVSDNKVVTSKIDDQIDCRYTYNQKGRLAKVEDKDEVAEYTWNEGRLTNYFRESKYWGGSSIKILSYFYSGAQTKGGWFASCDGYFDDLGCMAMYLCPDRVGGVERTDLPDRIVEDSPDGTKTINCAYEIGMDGYVSRAVYEMSGQNNELETVTATFMWQ